MKVKDILIGKPPIEFISVRVNSPILNEDNMLFGYCSWDGEKLISRDGDTYYIDEEITNYEFNDDGNL